VFSHLGRTVKKKPEEGEGGVQIQTGGTHYGGDWELRKTGKESEILGKSVKKTCKDYETLGRTFLAKVTYTVPV